MNFIIIHRYCEATKTNKKSSIINLITPSNLPVVRQKKSNSRKNQRKIDSIVFVYWWRNVIHSVAESKILRCPQPAKTDISAALVFIHAGFHSNRHDSDVEPEHSEPLRDRRSKCIDVLLGFVCRQLRAGLAKSFPARRRN